MSRWRWLLMAMAAVGACAGSAPPCSAAVTIDQVRLLDYRIPRTQAFVTAKGQSDTCYGIFVLIEASDGAGTHYTALGDCLPRTKVTSESLADARTGAQAMAKSLIGKTFAGVDAAADVDAIRADLHELNDVAAAQALTWKKPPAKDKQLRATLCGFDEALLDLVGQVDRKPVYELLGGAKRDAVSVSAMTFGADTGSDDLDTKVDDTADNFAAIRLKIGLDDQDDLKKLSLVASELQKKKSQAVIWVDANQAWGTSEKSLAMLGRIRDALAAADFKSTFICEQPTIETDLPALAETTKQTREWNKTLPFKILIMVDEAMWTVDDAKRVVATKAADFVNIKIQKAGGLLASKEIGDYLASAAPDIGVYVGGVVATDVTSWANLQLCYALPRLDYETGSIPRRAYPVNVASKPIRYSTGKEMARPSEPGLGTGLDLDKLQEYIRRDSAKPTTQAGK